MKACDDCLNAHSGDQHECPMYGALLTFKPGTTKAKAEAALWALVMAGVLEQGEVGVTGFDPERTGWPVWYIA